MEIYKVTFYFFITFLLKYNKHMEKGINHKCTLQWIFIMCAHPSNQQLNQT